jgi:hypothetical protein
MHTRTLNILVLLASSLPLLGQVDPSATGGSGETSDDSYMTMPVAVSGGFYPTGVASQTRANFLTGGVIATAAYDDNVLSNGAAHPVGAEIYTIWPTLNMLIGTSRTQGMLSYSPGFTFYDPTSDLNSVTQSAVANFHYRVTPRTTLGFQDSFQQNSTVFSQPYTLSGATVSGTSGAGTPIVILPYAGQINNSVSTEIGYQVSRSAMIGASGSYSFFNFTNTGPEFNLYDSTNAGGSAFYARRLGRSQYLGVAYGYNQSETTPVPTTTRSQTGSVFYALALPNRLTISLKGGPEYATTDSPGNPTSQVWAPSGVASIGWQTPRTNFALSYSRAVTTGWGLLGVYTTDAASASAQWQMTRRLTGGVNASYANVQIANKQVISSLATGHNIFGQASMQYQLSEHVTAVAQYNRLHETYSTISEVAADPDADRAAVSINYSFRRPLGK